MKKKIVFTIIMIIFVILMSGVMSVSAAKYGDFTYSVSNGTATITDCNTSVTGELIIPDTIGGCPVTTIDSYAFYKCERLTGITIPDTVTAIGNHAFYICSGLKHAVIGNGVQTIGEKAFAACYGLTEITVGESVKSIGATAFEYCNALVKVNITDVSAWCNIVFKYSDSNPLNYAEELYLDGKLVKDLIIPDGVTSIGRYAFYNFSGITSVTVPDSVTNIGDDAFVNCTGLKRVNINDIAAWCGIRFGNEYADAYANPLYYAGNLYLNGSLVTELTIPDGVIEIPSYAFYNCSSLRSVAIPGSVTSVGGFAFENCTGLTDVKLSEGVISIGLSAFENCTSMTDIAIPNGVTTIDIYSFENCTGLTEVSIPDTVKNIGYKAFYNCTALTRVNITDIEAWCNIIFSIFWSYSPDKSYDYSSNPLYYAKNLYLCGSRVTDLVIPEGVETIGNAAFYNCSGLVSVIIPDSVASIGNFVFTDCPDLKYIVLPEELEVIRQESFNNCLSINTVFYEGGESEWNEILFYDGNEALTNAKVVFDAEKKTYKLETNCNETLPDINDYAVFDFPAVNNEGKLLVGWYDNPELNGNPVTFPYYGSETMLYASWTSKTDCFEGTETQHNLVPGGADLFIVTPKYLPVGCEIIFVCYNGGKLVEVASQINQNEVMYFIPQNQFDEVKIMAWNSVGEMKSLCDVENVEL